MRSQVEMSDLILDELLIDNFREMVNSNAQFVDICRNIDGKNKLNIIYSAMDWINVAVDGTKNLDIEIGGTGYNHQNTINLMQYVMLVDLIFESVRQMYRVFERFGVSYPYSESKHIFNQEEVTDDVYFKHLRAIFGIHPVNLKSIDGSKEGDRKYYFASWVAHGMIEHDFIVQIYGNSIDHDESTIVGIKVSELNQFVRERYTLLHELIYALESITSEHQQKYKEKKIDLSSDRVLNTEILINENNERFGSFKGYRGLLNYMLRMFRVDLESHTITFEKSIIENYLNELENKFEIIKNNLESMEYREIKIGIRARGYEFEKIIDYLYTGDHPIGEEYFMGLVKFGDLPIEFLQTINDFELYRLVYDCYLFSKMGGKDYLVYKELIKEGAYKEKGVLGFTGYSL